MTAIISWTLVNERTLSACSSKPQGICRSSSHFSQPELCCMCFSATQLSLLKTCRASTRKLTWLCNLGRRLHAKKRLIYQAILVIFGQRRKAMQSADVEKHKRHDGPRRRSLWHNKQKWTEQVESTAENNLLCGDNYAAHAPFRQIM